MMASMIAGSVVLSFAEPIATIGGLTLCIAVGGLIACLLDDRE